VHERQEEQARVIAEAVERLQQNGDVLQVITTLLLFVCAYNPVPSVLPLIT
jgi:hypothetical protein